ncbi:MAG TPA: TIGR02265 family protein [Archangium sp.]
MSPELQLQLEQYRTDNEQRLARLHPSDTIKGLFIRRYLDLCEELGGAALRDRGLECLDEKRIFDFVNYPYASIVRMGTLLSLELAPRYPSVDAWLRDMGRLATVSYLRSLLGRAFLSTLSPSPRAMLTGMPWAIKTTFAFGERSVAFPGEKHCVFSCRGDFSPAASNAGAVQSAIEEVGAKDVVVTVQSVDLFNYDLDVRWR